MQAEAQHEKKYGNSDLSSVNSIPSENTHAPKIVAKVRPLSGMGALRGGKLEPKRLKSGKTVNRISQGPKQAQYKLAPEYKALNKDLGFKF